MQFKNPWVPFGGYSVSIALTAMNTRREQVLLGGGAWPIKIGRPHHGTELEQSDESLFAKLSEIPMANVDPNQLSPRASKCVTICVALPFISVPLVLLAIPIYWLWELGILFLALELLWQLHRKRSRRQVGERVDAHRGGMGLEQDCEVAIRKQ